MTTYYSPSSCFRHYLHMAEGNFRTYLRATPFGRRSTSMFCVHCWLAAGSSRIVALRLLYSRTYFQCSKSMS